MILLPIYLVTDTSQNNLDFDYAIFMYKHNAPLGIDVKDEVNFGSFLLSFFLFIN